MPTLDWAQCPAVESVPGKVSSAWVFRNTRMSVQAIFENLEAGISVQEITETYDVSEKVIKAAIRFAIQSLDKEPSYG